MRAASAALLAAGMFFAGVLLGGRGVLGEGPPPVPVTLAAAEPSTPGPTPSDRPLVIEEVPREVDEGSIDEYGDDSSGPGPGTDDPDGDNSGPGSDSSGPGSDGSGSGSDNSGPGSDDSGSGSSGSGTSGSGSSGSGSSGSGSDSSGPGS